MKTNSSNIRKYSEVQIEEVDWVWYPYIPYGKITLLQGDPGGGKSTLILNVLAALSRGIHPYYKNEIGTPKRIIYQCSEDGVADTIKPRLLMAGADCKNIAFINESEGCALTIDDERIRNAIIDFEASVLVIDPIQAYIGSDSDLMVAAKARRIMRRLSMWADAYNCAVILIGHINKKEGAKDLYRGLGSIDLVASARSVLHVEAKDDVREVHQIKNSLAPKGGGLSFIIDPDFGFRWNRSEGNLIETCIETEDSVIPEKQTGVANIIVEQLRYSDKTANDMKQIFNELHISERTANRVKKILGVNSYRKDGIWYWHLPSAH